MSDTPHVTPAIWPVTPLSFGEHVIRVAKRADHNWFVVRDIVAAIPDAQYTLIDLDEEDHWRSNIAASDTGYATVEVISEKGALTLATLLPGSTDPREPAYHFRLWLWREALPMLGLMGVPTPAPGGVGKLPANAKKVLDIIRRSEGISLSHITRATQTMGAKARREAIALLEQGGSIVAETEPSGGRPSTCYRAAP